jgi:DNA-binding PadR family transcriptional regulator
MYRPVPDEVVLGLVKSKPMHGYELLDRFRAKSHLGRFWTMSNSQIYAVLKRLEENGAIYGEEVKEPNVPSKIVYSITSCGLQELENWLYDPKPSSSIHLIRVIFISRLYVAELLGYQSEKIIQYQKHACVFQLQRTNKEFSECETPIEALTLKYVVGQLEAALLWLDECQQTLL